jgi:hypothetical protein
MISVRRGELSTLKSWRQPLWLLQVAVKISLSRFSMSANRGGAKSTVDSAGRVAADGIRFASYAKTLLDPLAAYLAKFLAAVLNGRRAAPPKVEMLSTSSKSQMKSLLTHFQTFLG